MRRSTKYQFFIGSAILGLLILASFAFIQVPAGKHNMMTPKNLQILPRNIEHSQLIHIMDEYCMALGYKCYNCHAPSASGHGMDFASDAKPQKRTARKMMKMVEKLNKKFFQVKGSFADNFNNARYEVSCYTCHHGSEHPMKFAPLPPERQGPPPPPGGNPN